MHARAPASSSNLGPGFDVLGLALRLYVEVEVHEAPRLRVVSEGEGADLPTDASHLAARVATEVVGHDRLSIWVRSQIPLGRGLGSSAALAVAAAAAAGSADPLLVAARCDGHVENAAASVLGGLVAATSVDNKPVARRLALDPSLQFVVVVPDRQLATETARSVLPEEVRFDDAVFNLGRMALLLAGLGKAADLIQAAGADRLHQKARTAQFPEAAELLAALEQAGAVLACWSGAGPSLLAICRSEDAASRVRDAGEEGLARAGLPGRALILRPDLIGLSLKRSPA